MQADPKERKFFVEEMLPHFERANQRIDELHGLIEGLKIPQKLVAKASI